MTESENDDRLVALTQQEWIMVTDSDGNTWVRDSDVRAAYVSLTQQQDHLQIELLELHKSIAALGMSKDGQAAIERLTEERENIHNIAAGLGRELAEECEIRRQAEVQRDALKAAVEKFFDDWPAVEKAVNGIIGLQFARTGMQYTGPTLIAALDQMRAALALAEGAT